MLISSIALILSSSFWMCECYTNKQVLQWANELFNRVLQDPDVQLEENYHVESITYEATNFLLFAAYMDLRSKEDSTCEPAEALTALHTTFMGLEAMKYFIVGAFFHKNANIDLAKDCLKVALKLNFFVASFLENEGIEAIYTDKSRIKDNGELEKTYYWDIYKDLQKFHKDLLKQLRNILQVDREIVLKLKASEDHVGEMTKNKIVREELTYAVLCITICENYFEDAIIPDIPDSWRRYDVFWKETQSKEMEEIMDGVKSYIFCLRNCKFRRISPVPDLKDSPWKKRFLYDAERVWDLAPTIVTFMQKPACADDETHVCIFYEFLAIIDSTYGVDGEEYEEMDIDEIEGWFENVDIPKISFTPETQTTVSDIKVEKPPSTSKMTKSRSKKRKYHFH